MKKDVVKGVEVVPYNPVWPLEFEIEADKIKTALGKCCLDIHHVGSTSVPGLAAKPRIDIIVVLNDTLKVIEKLEAIGYQYKGEFNIPFHFGFSKRTVPQVNLHAYETGNSEIELNLLFRDYLRSHPQDRDTYQNLKYDLLKQETSHQKQNSMFKGYTLGKDAFIKNILNKAGFQGLCLRFACHYDEWEAIRTFRKQFFDKLGLKDTYDFSIENPNHFHFLFYKGTVIIGYVNIVILSENTAKLCLLIMHENYKSQKHEVRFLELCDLWFKRRHIKFIKDLKEA